MAAKDAAPLQAGIWGREQLKNCECQGSLWLMVLNEWKSLLVVLMVGSCMNAKHADGFVTVCL